MMTPKEIRHQLFHAFFSLYGKTCSSIDVHGAGSEVVRVCVTFPTQPDATFCCEIPSDDDGFFRFTLEGTDLIVLIPYPA